MRARSGRVFEATNRHFVVDDFGEIGILIGHASLSNIQDACTILLRAPTAIALTIPKGFSRKFKNYSKFCVLNLTQRFF